MSSKGAEITTVVTEVKKIEGWKYGLKGKNKKIWVRRNIEYQHLMVDKWSLRLCDVTMTNTDCWENPTIPLINQWKIKKLSSKRKVFSQLIIDNVKLMTSIYRFNLTKVIIK